MQSETGFPSSRQLKSYVASKSRLKLAARAVLSADAGLLVVLEAHFITGSKASRPNIGTERDQITKDGEGWSQKMRKW